jgi:hypothetical protein
MTPNDLKWLQITLFVSDKLTEVIWSHLKSFNSWGDKISYLINKRQVHLGWNGEVGGQTVHLTENLISMNLLQLSCVITWAQKKFSLQPQKKNWGCFYFFYFLKLGFRLWNFSTWSESFHANLKKVDVKRFQSSDLFVFSRLLYCRGWWKKNPAFIGKNTLLAIAKLTGRTWNIYIFFT